MTYVDMALERVQPGFVIGLGTGRAATAFIEALAQRVAQGLAVSGVCTSLASERLATRLRIPTRGLDSVEQIDLSVDGADEVDPQGWMIKGYGGAFVREKIVAASARERIYLVGAEKCVPYLGARGKLPVEIVPFALPLCLRALRALGLHPELREQDGRPVASDNGNRILDCRVGPLTDPAALDAAIQVIPGVIDTGLFLDLVDEVLVQHPDHVEVLRPRTSP